MPSEICSLANQLQTALREGQTNVALCLCNSEANKDVITNNSWDLIPVLTEHLSEAKKKSNLEVFKCSEYLLMVIAEKSNPEEVTLQFVAEIEEAKDDSVFISVLKPLSAVLAKINNQKVNSFAWSFNAIRTYLSKCETPAEANLIGKEKLLMDSSDAVRIIVKLYSQVLVFYQNQVDLILKIGDKQCKLVLCKFLICLLGKPLGYLDMEEFDNIKCKPRLLAEDIVALIFKLISDPYSLLQLLHEKENELITPDKFSLSILYYLIYAENVYIKHIPAIYSSVYTFQMMLGLINCLFEKDRNLSTEKAIKFANIILQRIEGLKLSYLLLDSKEHSKFCDLMSNIIVYHSEESIRKVGLSILRKYLQSFELHGFYLLVFNLMSTLNHSGLIGYIITMYKDAIAEEFVKDENHISVYCRCPKLLLLLKRFCYLPQGEETDLIEISDQVIATLNLLRYLALRDNNNVTKIWDHFAFFDEKYLKYLRRGIDLSRAHYKLKIKEINEEPSHIHCKTDVSVNVLGKGIPEMTKEEKIKVLNSSLTAFDVMESIMSRVGECIGCKLNKKVI